MLSKKDAKVKVEQIKGSMKHLINVPVLVKLGPHVFEMQISDISLVTIASLAIQPDKVYNEHTGKQATPQVMEIRFTGGESIHIVMDDIDKFITGVSTAIFSIGSQELIIQYDSKNA